MSSHLKHFAVLGILLWLTSSFLVIGFKDGISNEAIQTFSLSETDLNRAEWTMDHYSNPGFEQWADNHQPEDLYTWRTTEHYTWYAEAPWPVNEGARSRGLQSRAIDPNHPAEAYMSRSTWLFWDNPTNLTLRFDWYIESLPQPIDYDYFRLEIELGAPGDRHMYYYLNCEDTTRANSTGYMYFFIDGASQTWNTFDRNVTADYFEIAGSYPTEFQQFRFELLTKSSVYSRTFLDDLWMTNGTVIYGGTTGNGNFESNSGWYSASNNEPADISRSSVRQEGDWSLNATSISTGNQSRLSVQYNPDRRLSSLNPDTFSFQWMMDDFQGASEDTFAYIGISGSNESDSTDVFYVICYGDNTNSFTWPGALVINATGFNTTGQWNSFSRSIWNDVISVYETNYLVIESIEIEIQVRGISSRISILFDDMKFESASLDDMGYEDQPAVGEMALSWSASSGPTPEFTVSDTAYTGSKAANLTLINGNSWSGDVQFDNRPVNQHTDTWLDFYWMIADSSEDANNLLYLELYFDSGESLGYIFANYSDVPTGNGFDEFFIVPEANSIGIWHNFQRNLFDDFVISFGTEPDTKLSQIYLYAEADTGGRLEILFDDVYLYNDPAPEISEIFFTPTRANVDVNVSAKVYDLSPIFVTLFYQIDGGTWTDIDMIYTGIGFNATIPDQIVGTEVSFYIEAVDSFGQTSQSVNIGYTVTDIEVPPPMDLLPLIIVIGVIAVVGVVIIVYVLFIKPKQSAK